MQINKIENIRRSSWLDLFSINQLIDYSSTRFSSRQKHVYCTHLAQTESSLCQNLGAATDN